LGCADNGCYFESKQARLSLYKGMIILQFNLMLSPLIGGEGADSGCGFVEEH
jgi:hypothetical protein